MQISVSPKQLQAYQTDALIVPIFEGERVPGGVAAAVDTALGASDGVPGDGAISALLKLGDFDGSLNATAVLYTNRMIPAPRVILIGLGRAEALTTERVRQTSATALRRARDLGCTTAAGIAIGSGRLPVDAAAQATIEGLMLGGYQYSLRSGSGPKALTAFTLLEYDKARHDAIRAGVQRGATLASATNAARDWVNAPPNELTPAYFAERAQDAAEKAGLRCTVLDVAAMRKIGMHSLLAAARGSVNAPRFVVLDYLPDGASTKAPPALALVGKGVTFDSGGYSIKSTDGMLPMKGDMGGAAAVLGAMQAIAALGAPGRVMAFLPMIENMISGDAMRPGDVVTTLSGLTVEIVNTDAEGRLILCDALTYARRQAPRAIVDIATLTAQASIAMGDGVAASLHATDDALAEAVQAAADAAGERLWRMPLFPEYGHKIRSDVADLKNSAGLKGGLGATAFFLKRFVDGPDAPPWAHIDMSGMAFDSVTSGHRVRGASGYGVRMLAQLAREGLV
jgi:leucyl aminopeptidase